MCFVGFKANILNVNILNIFALKPTKHISKLIKCTFRLPKNKDPYIIIYDITGFCCALFDEGVGRVVEDYFNPCSDCPFVYQSDDVSKCKDFHLIFLFYYLLCRKS